jgi:hypothetical protein
MRPKSLYLVIKLVLLLAQAAIASQCRAVVVGIDTYEPERPAGGPGIRTRWTNLDGAVLDAVAFSELLAARFGFKPADIRLLKNREATRSHILAAIQGHLIDPVKPGDTCVFFFAGHGSQVTNSLSSEADKRDESLVPSDSCLGAPDLRDKELARLFNAIIDKKAVFTAIIDSCHSGSVARGYPLPGKSRALPLDTRDCHDGSTIGERPEERGALILSSAQDDQLAGEQCDDDGTSHGRFTLALLSTLRAAAPSDPVDQLFRSIRARMQAGGSPQEPVLAGKGRLGSALFGQNATIASGQTTVAILKVPESAEIHLQAGRAIGLLAGCELTSLKDKSVRLRVQVVESLTRSRAQLISGARSSLHPGDLLVVDRWVPPESRLRVWVGAPHPDRAGLDALLKEIHQIARDLQIPEIEDPTLENPTHVIRFDGSAWTLTMESGTVSLGVPPIGPRLRAKLSGQKTEQLRLFVDIPPPPGLREALVNAAGSTSFLQWEEAPASATYLLVGRPGPPHAFAWVLPGTLQKDSQRLALPVRTDWLPESPEPALARKLHEFTSGISKVKAWLELEPPPNSGLFPYRLVLRDSKTHSVVTRETVVELLCQSEDLARPVERRYVYVFAIDSYGHGTLLFPRASAGSVENRLPVEDAKGNFPTEIPLGPTITVQPPFGLDTLVMLTTDEALPQPDIFDFRGVRTRGDARRPGPLSRLLDSLNKGQRGFGVEPPASWSIQRVMMRSQSAAWAQ